MTKTEEELFDLIQDNPIPDSIPNDMYVTEEFDWYWKAKIELLKRRAAEIQNGNI